MKIQDAIKNNYEMAQMVSGSYIADLTNEEAMQRPHAGCNHINWQVGHIIASQNMMANSAVPGAVPELPEGFAAKYAKGAGSSNNPADFLSFDELRSIGKAQSEAVVSMIESMSTEDFDKPGPKEMEGLAPNLGALCNLLGSHWMMHAGQWVVVRRQLGREIVI